jgi:hypothetical protein
VNTELILLLVRAAVSRACAGLHASQSKTQSHWSASGLFGKYRTRRFQRCLQQGNRRSGLAFKLIVKAANMPSLKFLNGHSQESILELRERMGDRAGKRMMGLHLMISTFIIRARPLTSFESFLEKTNQPNYIKVDQIQYTHKIRCTMQPTWQDSTQSSNLLL